MRLSRRTSVAAAIAGAASIALLATGCSTGGTDNASGGDEDVTLTITTFGTFGYDDLYKQYEEENPGVTIRATNIDTGGNARTDAFTKIAAPIDFLGVNHYHDDNVSGHPQPASARPSLKPTAKPGRSPFPGSEYVTFPTRGLPRTAMDWEVNPDGLETLLVRLGHEYPNLPPLYITENGAAYDGDVVVDGVVDDPERRDYILAHIGAVTRAIDGGADVRGYFVWSLLDNFEWAWGYAKRFGIVHVDYDTFVRTPKASALAYADVIRQSKASDRQALADDAHATLSSVEA